MAQLGAELLLDTLDKIEQGEVNLHHQDDLQVTYAPKLTKEDGLIKWDQTASMINNHFRAMQPWPGSYTFFKNQQGKNIQINLIRINISDQAALNTHPGTIINFTKEGIEVATGSGSVTVIKLKPANHKEINAQDFINGYRIKIGDCFGKF